MNKLFLGVVADDFTGASDAASFLVEAGVPTVMCSGVPQEMPSLREDTAAIVIAMKTRTMPREEAVRDMLSAFRWLKQAGAEKLYFKYCATFDSTEEGNIGPVADAVLEEYGIPYTVLCPALPVNGRTVKDGKLYVNGIPLSESHMRNHPLTPMRESDVTKLMNMQSKYRAGKISVPEMTEEGEKGAEEKLRESAEIRYLVPEFYENGHGDLIAETFWNLPFLTGGSGLCGALGRHYASLKQTEAAEEKASSGFAEAAASSASENGSAAGAALLLAGSCSKVTLEQIADYREKGYPSLQVLPEKLLSGEQTAETVFSWIETHGDQPLVYSSQAPEELKKSQALGAEKVAEAIEKLMSELAKKSVEKGRGRIISAGGETSGAVTQALGYQAFYIGKSAAPGVPVMTPVERPDVRIVLKSGGFGQKDFFADAEKLTREC